MTHEDAPRDCSIQDFFGQVLASEVAMVRCRNCNTDQPVNNAYLPYLKHGLTSCAQCRAHQDR